MSGGVDSSVAALLLKKQGYEVIGATYDFWHDDDAPEDIYRNLSDASEAKAVADAIGIRHVAVNYTKQFRERVEKSFVSEYLNGRTPNPCVMCNPLVKWAALCETADEYGAKYVATGHYARIDRLPNGRYAIKNSVTAKKDQTYVLYGLSQVQLSRSLMPIGDYEKDEIRKIAAENALPVASKPDSQEICFVSDNDYAAYIDAHTDVTVKEGNFVDKNGNILGRNKGITHYTIGQRRGLEIAAGHRIFVTDIRPETGEVVLGENEELFTTEVLCSDLRFMSVSVLKEGEKLRVKAKIRYNHQGEYGEIEALPDNKVICRFEKPVRAATPGQSMVFYDGDYVLGGGIICRF
ncbi:MAG: tRNA 2-thiouridine(34) synthase MnmA [Lachnospiraceae bacterium]|nr:tRNA 2-thiouridine(34) synthase MnmA [Lachnospiraceae bacterium]